MKKYPVNANKHKGRPKQVPRAVLRHLEITRKEVQRLIHFYEVFMEFNDIAMQSTVAKKESEFWTFAKLSFGGEIVHRIDRLCEKKPAQKKWKVHSLLALLEELKAYAHLINREQYVGVVPNTAEAFAKKYPDEFDPPDCYFFFHRNDQFSRFAGKKNFSLTIPSLEQDIRKLRRVSLKITKYRNKHLAHIAHDRMRFKNAPSLKELEAAIGTIWKITDKFIWLIKKSYYPMSDDLTDITEIFMKPWISDSSSRRRLQDSFHERQRASLDRFEK